MSHCVAHHEPGTADLLEDRHRQRARGRVELRPAWCDDCRMTDRLSMIDDDIIHHRMLPALMALRGEFSYSIPEAIDAFSERYEQLRETRPQEFTVSREDYGKDFYS